MNDKLTQEDRATIKRLTTSEDWKSIDKVFESAKLAHANACCTQKEDHRYHQGKMAAIVQLQATLKEIDVQSEVEKLKRLPVEQFRPLTTATHY